MGFMVNVSPWVLFCLVVPDSPWSDGARFGASRHLPLSPLYNGLGGQMLKNDEMVKK